MTLAIRKGVMALGPNGWQSADHSWRPDAVEATPEGPVLEVGPAVVRHMENGNYRIEVTLPGGEVLAAGLTWRDIPPPPDTERVGGRRRGGVAIGPAPERIVPPIVEPPPLPPPEPALPPPPPTPRPVSPPPAPVRRSRRRWEIGAVAVVLLAIGGAIVYLRLPVPPPPPVDNAARTEKPDASRTERKDNTAPGRTVSPVEEARLALRDPNTSAAEEIDKAHRMPTNLDGADAAFLLLEDAANVKHDGQAAFEVGRYYDPLDTAPNGTIKKRASRACSYYRMAQAAGIGDAAARLDGLKLWAEQKASDGDADAEATLRCLK